ncbi:MAG: glucose-1-phosphate thymidylyltransferase [Bacillota bacterium]|nr:glucose-1-phosphate thymidylyltransferase [Bacillota bacterium]
MKGLILSGGLGTRLLPFTLALPKQLIPVANKPVLWYILDAFKKIGIKEIGVVVGENKEVIATKMNEVLHQDLKLQFIVQEKPLGLAHAVKTAAPFLHNSDFVMILGDNLFDESLEEALKIFSEEKADALLFLTPVRDPRRYGIAEVKEGQIISLEEKPTDPRSNYAVMGIYFFKNSIFEAIERTTASRRGELEITDAIQELINAGRKVVPYIYPGWWMDVGRPEDVLKANRLLLNLLTPDSSCLVAPTAMVSGSTLKGPLIIGENCTIVDSVIGPYTSVGNGSSIKGSSVENSVLFEKVTIQGFKGTIMDSIIGQDTAIYEDSSGKNIKKFFLGAGSTLTF